MGLKAFFQSLFRRDPPPGDELLRDSSPPEPAADPTRREADPLAEIKRLHLAAGVRRAVDVLEHASSAPVAVSVARWLRESALSPEVPPEDRLFLADFFLRRGEPDMTEALLVTVSESSPRLAAPALMRLGDLAEARGDSEGAARRFEEVLALDLEYPGARERRLRTRRPARAGVEGATLLAPEASVGVGAYALLRELGRGGAGAVFLARDRRLEREVAIKIYHPAARVDRNARLRGEARVAVACAAPEVVRVHDLHEEVGALVMEYAGGGSVRARVAAGVPVDEARRWLVDLARGLEATHREGWVHRDVKPGNVLLREDGRAVLTDFGLARLAGTPVGPREGTPAYLPPESAQAGVADPRVDVYAFGVMARELRAERDPAMASLIDACLAPDPARRPADGAALVAALAT
ncbi:MAG: serine/threonine-protein kinase [Polyangiales bacterium]